MGDLVFPLAAVGGTFLLVIPLLTLLSRRVLAFKRTRARDWASFGSEITFAWLVAPTLLPILWLTSSALHQTEPATSQTSCWLDQVEATTCFDALLLVGLMLGGMLLTVGLRAWRERPRLGLKYLADDASLPRRIARLTQGEPALEGLRIKLAIEGAEPAFTMGWFRPVVVLDASFVDAVDDEIIRTALLHEAAHIAGFDTFRGFMVRLCLSLNPAAELLKPDFERWRRAREAQCDGVAVHRGAEPLALAAGILKAVRFQRQSGGPIGAAMLCGHDAAALKLRVALLMNGPPRPIRTAGHLVLGAAVVAVLTLPHVPGAGALEHFHFEVERLLHSLL